LILLSLSGRLYTFDRIAGISRELKTGLGQLIDPQFSPDGTKIAYVLDHDVFVLDLVTQKERRVTDGGSTTLSHGLAEFIAQEEMGRFSGYWWSPDSKKIAYQETDAKGVEVWHVADPIHPEQEPTPFFYPRPGKANVKVRLGVVPVDGGKTTWIDWDAAKLPYLAGVRWPGPLLVTVQSRDQTALQALQYDDLGKMKLPTIDVSANTWVNLRQEFPHWIEAKKADVSLTEYAPQLQLELGTDMKSTVLAKNNGLRGLVHVDKSGDWLVYSMSADPTQLHLYRCDLAKGYATKQLTKGIGQFSAAFCADGSIYVLTARLKDAMPKTTVHKIDGTLIGELPSVAEEAPFEPNVELVVVGDLKFHAAIVRPRKFDAKKKYPVMVDVYGGPHHQHVVASKQRWLLDQWYADQGFIVVAIDGRGTPGRGRDWERAIKYKFGSLPLDDQVLGLQALGEKYPEMDLKRVGIDGWSFGGYMAALAVLRRPDVFHAAVAGAPVVDWHDYDTHYTERYLGVPTPPGGKTDAMPDSPRYLADAAYKQASLLTYAADLRRPLLLLHGTADDNVYFRHSLRLADALFRAGKDFEILPLSGLTHMVPDPVVMENLHGRIARFLQKHLGRPE
jgi:dipeptidyl-peptidase 4